MTIRKLPVVAVATAVSFSLAAEAMAVEWNVSLWGKRRAFTEHVEKLAELVSEKTGGDFTLNISYGGLSKNTENLDGISIGAFEMAQFCAGYHADKNPRSPCWNCRSWASIAWRRKSRCRWRSITTRPLRRIWPAGMPHC